MGEFSVLPCKATRRTLTERGDQNMNMRRYHQHRGYASRSRGAFAAEEVTYVRTWAESKHPAVQSRSFASPRFPPARASHGADASVRIFFFPSPAEWIRAQEARRSKARSV
jgi:hypothetical protein